MSIVSAFLTFLFIIAYSGMVCEMENTMDFSQAWPKVKFLFFEWNTTLFNYFYVIKFIQILKQTSTTE